MGSSAGRPGGPATTMLLVVSSTPGGVPSISLQVGHNPELTSKLHYSTFLRVCELMKRKFLVKQVHPGLGVGGPTPLSPLVGYPRYLGPLCTALHSPPDPRWSPRKWRHRECSAHGGG